MGTLYVVATPIGNLEDITYRAVRTLHQVALIAAEDTRTSHILLRHYDIQTPTTSYFEHNKLAKLDRILAALESGDVALISDAGTPGISDPGYELVRAVLEAGHRVEPIPGPNAIVTALSAAGLPTDRFTFLGFLPRKVAARKNLLDSLATRPETLIFYEAPHRIRSTVAQLVESLGPERQAVLARELTKRYEEFLHGPLAELAAQLELTEPRGEFTVLVSGQPANEQTLWDEEAISRLLLALQADGLSGSRAVKEAVRLSGQPRSDVYALWLSLQEGDS